MPADAEAPYVADLRGDPVHSMATPSSPNSTQYSRFDGKTSVTKPVIFAAHRVPALQFELVLSRR
jgi:hypothetical protein